MSINYIKNEIMEIKSELCYFEIEPIEKELDRKSVTAWEDRYQFWKQYKQRRFYTKWLFAVIIYLLLIAYFLIRNNANFFYAIENNLLAILGWIIIIGIIYFSLFAKLFSKFALKKLIKIIPKEKIEGSTKDSAKE